MWKETAAVCAARSSPVEMRGYTKTLQVCFHEALSVLYMLLYVSNFALAAAEVSDKTEVWDKTQLLEVYSKCSRPARHVYMFLKRCFA